MRRKLHDAFFDAVGRVKIIPLPKQCGVGREDLRVITAIGEAFLILKGNDPCSFEIHRAFNRPLKYKWILLNVLFRQARMESRSLEEGIRNRGKTDRADMGIVPVGT